MGKVWVLASVAIATASSGLPAQASVAPQGGGGGPPALAARWASLPSVQAQASLGGRESSAMPQARGTGCDPGDSLALPGWLCLSLGDQFRDRPQGIGRFSDVGSTLAAVQSPVTAQGQAPGPASD